MKDSNQLKDILKKALVEEAPDHFEDRVMAQIKAEHTIQPLVPKRFILYPLTVILVSILSAISNSRGADVKYFDLNFLTDYDLDFLVVTTPLLTAAVVLFVLVCLMILIYTKTIAGGLSGFRLH